MTISQFAGSNLGSTDVKQLLPSCRQIETVVKLERRLWHLKSCRCGCAYMDSLIDGLVSFSQGKASKISSLVAALDQHCTLMAA